MSCVYISTKDPDDAERVHALLRGLGYRPILDLAELDVDVFEFATRAAGRRYGLTPREREVLLGLLRGRSKPQLAAELGVSKATIRWHLRNLEAKLGVEGGEATLRLVLHLDDPCWLRDPLRQREVLLRLVAAGEAVVGELERNDRDGLIFAGRALRSALVDGRREAAIIGASIRSQKSGADLHQHPNPKPT